jgi:hypothetical protein
MLPLAGVRQIEDAGRFPEANYAFDNGVLTLELTRLIEERGKHWVSEIECSRHINWMGQWRRVDEVGAELRARHLVIVHEQADLSDTPSFLLTDALHWESVRVIETWNYRWESRNLSRVQQASHWF